MIARNYILISFFCPISPSIPIFFNQYDIGLICVVIAEILLFIWND